MAKPDPRVQELLAIIQTQIDPLDLQYAIGGALAMAAHGYSRSTDVDLFVLEHTPRDRFVALQALRGAGLLVSAVATPFHYIAVDPTHVDPDVRIDVFFPASEPDLSGIEGATRKPIYHGGFAFKIYDVNLLALAKFYQDQDEADYDLRAMYTRGLFDPKVARMMIASMGDDEDLEDWDRLVATFGRRRRGERASKIRKSPKRK